MLSNTSTILKNIYSPDYFGEEMDDGRLTADFDSTAYHFKDMLEKRLILGRPLTDDEMAEFEI